MASAGAHINDDARSRWSGVVLCAKLMCRIGGGGVAGRVFLRIVVGD
jgi:hypothetical protein